MEKREKSLEENWIRNAERERDNDPHGSFYSRIINSGSVNLLTCCGETECGQSQCPEPGAGITWLPPT